MYWFGIPLVLLISIFSLQTLLYAVCGCGRMGGATTSEGEGLANRVHLTRAEVQIPAKVLVCNCGA